MNYLCLYDKKKGGSFGYLHIFCYLCPKLCTYTLNIDMKKLFSKGLLIALMAVGLASCKAPENIVYLQDVQSQDQLSVAALQMIRIRPGDQLSIIVSSRNPELCNIFNLAVPYRYVGATNFGAGSSSQTGYFTVASDGTIDYPVFGQIDVTGLTRQELAKKIKDKIVNGDYIKDPVVTVEYANLAISVLGEVTSPGKYNISKDRITLLEALSMARDLTINGCREDVLVLRENTDGSTQSYRVNLTSSALMESPVYYLQQNDVVYVSPNVQRRRQSEATGNTIMTPTFWLSITSTLCTVATLVYTLTK